MDSTVNLARPARLGRLGRRAVWSGIVAACLVGCATPPKGAGDPGARIQFAAIAGSRLVTLAGNTHPAARDSSVGPLEDGVLLEHMQLVLQRSPEQEEALAAHIDALHDPTSPLYQQWLTVDQFGDQYGVSPADVASITAWLESYGFIVESVPRSRMLIEFSGTVAQVNAAFNTRIDRLVVNGASHFANVSDPQIPEELAKVVVGVHALHDFKPHAMRKDVGQVQRDGASGSWRVTSPGADLTVTYGNQCFSNADCTSGTCNTTTGVCQCTANNQCQATLSGAAAQCNTTAKTCVQCQSNADCVGPATCNTTTKTCEKTRYALTPADFATIYNLNPLFAEGITGKGQTIAVLEDTLIKNASDVTTFRDAFGLGAPYTGTFTQGTVGGLTCGNPGVNAAESEAALDAEWASASAPDAAIVLAGCADTLTFGGLIALQNLINGNSPPQIVSMSYGECESQNGNTANKNFVTTYQQAAAMGVSVFVSAGDQGAAVCDYGKAVATHGIAVSGFASTPYNVAVGGTDFGDYVQSQRGGPAYGSYWSATNTATFGSALSYVPEIPWNDTCANSLVYSTPSVALGTYTQAYGAAGFCNTTLGQDFETGGIGAGSGGPSTYSGQPSWQTGVVGLPAKSGGHRGLPDVSLFAASGRFGHFLVYCMTDTAQQGGPCNYSVTGDVFANAAGGTSFASPAMAGIQALVNQKAGAATGNPNYTYYKLASDEQGLTGTTRCNSTGGTAASPVLPHAECVFHDVTIGDIDVNCTGTNCYGSTGTTVQGALSSTNATFTPAFAATTGWDYATGLGSVNAYNLVHSWSK